MVKRTAALLGCAGLLATASAAAAGDKPHHRAEGPAQRVTILYDSFGKSRSLTMDWGFAALVEYGGKRILFDTGNNARIFEHNVKALGVDLRRLDFVVISHRHADHTSGLSYVLRVNPKVRIYVPDEP